AGRDRVHLGITVAPADHAAVLLDRAGVDLAAGHRREPHRVSGGLQAFQIGLAPALDLVAGVDGAGVVRAGAHLLEGAAGGAPDLVVVAVALEGVVGADGAEVGPPRGYLLVGPRSREVVVPAAQLPRRGQPAAEVAVDRQRRQRLDRRPRSALVVDAPAGEVAVGGQAAAVRFAHRELLEGAGERLAVELDDAPGLQGPVAALGDRVPLAQGQVLEDARGGLEVRDAAVVPAGDLAGAAEDAGVGGARGDGLEIQRRPEVQHAGVAPAHRRPVALDPAGELAPH